MQSRDLCQCPHCGNKAIKEFKLTRHIEWCRQQRRPKRSAKQRAQK